MYVATLQGERTMADLINRLYLVPQGSQFSRLLHLKPREAEDLARRAETALRQANPALADLDKLPPGTVIVVPDVEGLQRTAAAQPSAAAGRDVVLDVRQDAGAAQKALF